jgi:eukaryotic-like serine/threonine-protein kinase
MGLSIPQITRMNRLLDEALQLDAAGRSAWLEALPEEHRDLAQALRDPLLPGDAQLAEIEKLAALPEIGTATEAGARSAIGLQIGGRVGPYELIRPLGVGGMAEVWFARRADGAFKREVALKLPLVGRLRTDLEQRDLSMDPGHVRFGRESA